MGNWLGLGSAWVSGQAIFSGCTANSYPRSTFDLVAFGGEKKPCRTKGTQIIRVFGAKTCKIYSL